MINHITRIFPLLLFCTFLFQTDFAFSQKKKKPQFHAETVRIIKKYDVCVYRPKYTSSQRLKLHPFSKAAKIVAISYMNWVGDPNDEIIIYSDTDKVRPEPKHKTYITGLKIKKGVLDTANVFEQRILTSHQINELTDLLYNYGYKKHYYTQGWVRPNCFTPRNAVLFFDRKGNIYDYIEICFECTGFSTSSKFNIGEDCTQKSEMLRKYFTGLNIRYGTITTDSLKQSAVLEN